MEFLGIGPLELVLIVLIALIILGPRDMVKVGNSIGKFLRRTILSPGFRDIQRKVRRLPYDLMREAGIEENELKELRSLQSELKSGRYTNPLQSMINQTPPPPELGEKQAAAPEAINPEPVILPTPEQPLVADDIETTAAVTAEGSSENLTNAKTETVEGAQEFEAPQPTVTEENPSQSITANDSEQRE